MSEKKKSLSNEEITTANVSRRSTFGILGAGVIAASVATVGVASTAQAIPNCTDRDPQDPGGNGRGRGISDSDPNDPVGCGSRACSDSDPNDPAGRGRHC